MGIARKSPMISKLRSIHLNIIALILRIREKMTRCFETLIITKRTKGLSHIPKTTVTDEFKAGTIF